MPSCSEHLSYSLQGQAGKPVLVFLHGLLGDCRDWQPVMDLLTDDFLCLAIDLPGHGGSRDVTVTGFDNTCEKIADTIQQVLRQPFSLVGYSLGARVAMYFTAHYAMFLKGTASPLQRLIIESGHPGLPEADRAARWRHDDAWARRFEKEPIVDVLQAWYQQPVFSSLNHAQRQSLVALRSDNLGTKVASMLRATSLSKQACLLEPLRTSGIPVHYLCGEKDAKFQALATQSGLAFSIVPDAGHNIHAEQPSLFCRLVRQLTDTI
ncbi:2-succinyl-6-hydroxy-2,4-cyclohexadiene-1-carboxylate synthase [Grimontia hollisae]|uniref:Putative 2-succinyl-6-hydroxy-2,4-cyclohexadiene-1-carboxylate synthase n=1 Tax=Grimontia hollisae TaxID=673 RepID=A0A377HLN9_GRIHO|nr:2-succinyl-6-hydroxy-2,4-cyclohexadiene-1-carboxylate synthase [Grimontia hollisae]STO56933.1 2-succinyl-6-hydroxy-2,4-cyclohexadiene-1-carboxylate synthase [Grimontia hollisae]